jgi:cell division transport system permease protein
MMARRSKKHVPKPPVSGTAAHSDKPATAPTVIDRLLHKTTPIVPSATVVGQTLTFVTAVMSFLACLALGSAWAVHRAANVWNLDVASEITVQVKPVENKDLGTEATRALAILSSTDGITKATIYSDEDTRALLEPWLGGGIDFSELPVPTLIAVEIDPVAPPNLAELATRLAEEVEGASLDDHQVWRSQVQSISTWLETGGFFVFFLMLGATIMITIFATRAAMAGNKDIVTVLHLVGARERFIAREFEQHFLMLGLKGGLAGGALAAGTFALAEFTANRILASPRADGSVSTLIEAISLGWSGYGAIAGVVAIVAFLTALTSRMTVYHFLRSID